MIYDIYGMIYLRKTGGIPCSSFPILVSMDCLRWGNVYRKHQPSGNIRNPGHKNTTFWTINSCQAQISPSDFWGPRIQLADEAPVLPSWIYLGLQFQAPPGTNPGSLRRLLAGFREVVRHVDEDAFLEPTTCPRATWKGLAPLNLKKMETQVFSGQNFALSVRNITIFCICPKFAINCGHIIIDNHHQFFIQWFIRIN